MQDTFSLYKVKTTYQKQSNKRYVKKLIDK